MTNDTHDDPAARDDYLWDRTGAPDPDVARLEGELARHRWSGRADDLGELPPRDGEPAAPHPPGSVETPKWLLRVAGSLAAAALLTVAAVWWMQDHSADVPRGARTPSYRLVALEGTPMIHKSDASAPADGTLPGIGERLVVDAGSRARLAVGDIGSVVLEGGTSLRIEDAGRSDAEHLLYLERGTVTASIFAAPRVFQMGTPAGITVDLGCIYETSVDEHGDTVLRVVSGQVAFESERRKVTVPSGARVLAWPGRGPGMPVWDDAAEDFKAAVDAWESADASGELADQARAMELVPEIIRLSEERDSLTLWHMLRDLAPRESTQNVRANRSRLFVRLAEVAPPPEGVSGTGILAGDADMLERWKDALGWSW